jgi:hypothetical protein
MGRLGLEPRTTGLTCRTGFHRPPAPRRRRCGLDHLFTLGRTGRVGGVWPLRALPHAGLPADRPIPGGFHRDGYSGALRGSQQIAADEPAISRLALLFVEVPCSAN